MYWKCNFCSSTAGKAVPKSEYGAYIWFTSRCADNHLPFVHHPWHMWISSFPWWSMLKQLVRGHQPEFVQLVGMIHRETVAVWYIEDAAVWEHVGYVGLIHEGFSQFACVIIVKGISSWLHKLIRNHQVNNFYSTWYRTKSSAKMASRIYIYICCCFKKNWCQFSVFKHQFFDRFLWRYAACPWALSQAHDQYQQHLSGWKPRWMFKKDDFLVILGTFQLYTLPETNIAPENGWFED